MSNIRLIKNKIESIMSTKKITRTMEMIAISKMRKAKSRLLSSQPYLTITKKIFFNIMQANSKYQHFIFKNRIIIKHVAIIVISSNKGLCGNLNNHIFHEVVNMVHDYNIKNIQCSLYIFGLKGFLFFRNKNLFCKKKYINLHEEIKHDELVDFVNNLLKKYKNTKIDKLFILNNLLYTTADKKINILQLLPISTQDLNNHTNLYYKKWDYLYEPDSVLVINILLKKYILFQIFQCILENITCEQSTRMIIMKNATENSTSVIQELNLIYNKTRQFNITQELIEIISGSSVV
ncbi:ATP synthase gamma chain [Buchnera aphidicola (Pterocallis alni)]|uniref:ATP synthase F1 subunit gamma n=1 Tax=Buchnera aphidicola TaxID=9 RepID=UPI0034649026